MHGFQIDKPNTAAENDNILTAFRIYRGYTLSPTRVRTCHCNTYMTFRPSVLNPIIDLYNVYIFTSYTNPLI